MTHGKTSDRIPDAIYKIAAAAVVMSGHDGASGMSGHEYVRKRIILRRDLAEFLEAEGIDVNVVVNRLLENWCLAYKAYWQFYGGKRVAPAGFEPASPDPESGRIDHYPTGLHFLTFTKIYQTFVWR